VLCEPSTDFERRRVVIDPWSELPTLPREWAGAIVVLEEGILEVVCAAGGRRTYVAGDILALDWLPIRMLRNPAPVPTRLLAVRRAVSSPRAGTAFSSRAAGGE
jgi:hypothetical protein